MSLLPHTLLNATSNEDQTLEIHSEILEPLSHSQTISRFEIPHKNILDSDSVLVWNVFWDNEVSARGANVGKGVMTGLMNSGVYNTLLRARLYVNGKIISELNEVAKYLTIKNQFQPHEVKTEVSDYYSYADNRLVCSDGKVNYGDGKVMGTPGSRSIGAQTHANGYTSIVEASLKLHQLFAILKDAQLDTNNIEGKIMIELDWNRTQNEATAAGNNSMICLGDDSLNYNLSIQSPRLILDFLTYNAEVQAGIKASIYGDGPGVNMPFREVALVRKTLVGSNQSGVSVDLNIGMTGRAIQKIWVAKVMDKTGDDVNITNKDCSSDLLDGQKWNMRINDLMIFDRDVENRAEEFNYLQQAGERQFTCAPSTYEIREGRFGSANNDIFADSFNLFYGNATPTNVTVNAGSVATNVTLTTAGDPDRPMVNSRNPGATVKQGTAAPMTPIAKNVMGRQNWLAIPLAKYVKGPESPLNAMRIGSTPIVFNLNYDGNGDAGTSAHSGTVYFFVEYLKMMNLKNGQITVMDL